MKNALVVCEHRQRVGVFRPDGSGVAAARRGHFYLDVDAQEVPPLDADRVAELPGSYAFGGVIAKQFGHILLETFARLTLFSATDLPILFVAPGEGREGLFWSMVDFLRLPRDRITLVSSPTRVGTLWITPPDFRIRESINLAFTRSYARLGTDIARELDLREISNPVPAYLSRSRIDPSGRYYFGETLIEQALADTGVDIVHVQEMSLEAQFAEILSRTTLHGFAGSAFHWLLMCGAPKRVTYLSQKQLNPNFQLIDALLPNEVTCVRLGLDAAGAATARKGPYLLSRRAILRACRACGAPIDPAWLNAGRYAACRDAYEAAVSKLPKSAHAL